MKIPLRAAGAAAVIVVLLLVVGILGNVRISGYLRASMEESIHQVEREIASKEVQESIEESKIEETAVHEIALTYTEEQLLKLLEEKLRANDLEGAARVLNENESAFQDLFFGKLADEICLYDGSVMKDEADGFGLVFQRAGTDGAKKTVKKGTFSNDLMEGEITYTSSRQTPERGTFPDDSGSGESTTWTMTVEKGVIVPDARWISDTSDDGTPVFRLMADTDDGHAYVVEADAMKEARWKNMIEWGE